MPKMMADDRKESMQVVDSLDCKGCQVMHLLELKGADFHFLLAIGHLA